MSAPNTSNEADQPITGLQKARHFWRRNQILLLQLPIMLALLVGSYVILKAWDSRIGVEGFGDLFGYALNGVRVTLIIFTGWWIKKWCWFDLYEKTELSLYELALSGDRHAFWIRIVDRVEWVAAFAFATYWYTR